MQNLNKQNNGLDEMLAILEEKLVEQQERGGVMLENSSKIFSMTNGAGTGKFGLLDFGGDLSLNGKDKESPTELRIKDRLLPLANVSKIMKASVPEVAKISKEAKALVQQSASEFIAIVTAKAKDIAAQESRKAVNGDDLVRAMDDLDLSCFSEITAKYFEQYKKTTNTYASLYFDQKREFYK
ncbi:NFYB3 [Enterospora canceri]|uniref:NFYB3 n=1 Tax=Enterospora canceri TaxID=1081671 RepID=A0A1Y1S7U3_9MICR|nr:NFYB3 [Enterospora canceri]